ncbi:MAG: hypothetical protein GY918_07770 [Gammaproteobacteria bacterium]|nr:hypothetical protein [Gammaproteobacteria bacterium]
MPLGINKAALFGVAGVDSGSAVLLSTVTTAGAASIEFTSGITDAYKQYVFSFYGVAPITNAQSIYMITSTDGGSSYGVTTTSTYFDAHQHIIWDTTAALEYGTSRDLAQSTSPQPIAVTMAMSTQTAGGNNTPGANLAGEFILYNPASTTYVKHWVCKTSWNQHLAAAYTSFIAGYVNTTSAVNAIKFYSASGNIAGTIKMWGIK